MRRNGTESDDCFRRKFPFGYLLHPDPFRYRVGDMNFHENSSCGQLLTVLYLLVEASIAYKSYLKVNPQGLEIYWHPNSTLFVGWNEVTRLERNKLWGIIPYEVLYLDRPAFQNPQKPIYLTKRIKEHFENMKLGIPLRLYHGWPNGELERALTRYIPHILIGTDR